VGPPSFDPGRAPSGGLDVLTQNAGEMARRVQTRDLAASIVTALFRLVKLSTLHSLDNQAMKRQVEETVALVNDYGQRTEHNVSILFAHGSVFVGGLLLRANRGIYEGALELGTILHKVGAAEIGIMRDARENDFYALASALADALRSAKPPRIDRPSPKIRLRGINAVALNREVQLEERLDPNLQVARTYASAVVIMRRFFEELRRGKYELPQRVKRVAQRLVDLSTGETPAFLGVTAARNANHDQAGRAVNTAILSLAMTRQITTDMVLLSRVAMAALLFDTARARIAGVVGKGAPGVMPQLSEQQEMEAPASTAVVLTALGRVNEPSVMRTVIGYEAHWVRRKDRLGPLYRGLRQPSMQSRIISVARTFNDLLTPTPGMSPLPADEAIARLEREATEPADRTAIRLLVGALGLFPTGTIVELSSGETALVVHTPESPSLYSQPRVRVVLDASGGWLARPIEVDLAQKRKGEPARHVRRVVATGDDPNAASLRDFAATYAPIAEAGAPSMMLGSSVQSQRSPSIAPATPPPSSVNILQTPGPRSPWIPTLESQYARRDSTMPAAPKRPIDVQVMHAPPPPRQPSAIELPHYVDEPDEPYDDGVDESQSTRSVSWEEQENLIAGERASSLPEPPVEAPLPPPTAEGTFSKTPLAHLLIYMLDQRLTGTTVFQAPDGLTHAIYFHDGGPAKVRTGTTVAPLDRVLLEMGLLDEPTLRGTLMEISKKNILHGRHLVMKGLLDREKIIDALRLQVMRKTTYLFELPPETRYAYYKNTNLLASYGGPELTPCEPLAAIMAGVRLRASDPMVDATLLRIAGRPLALHIDAELRRLQLQRDERSVVDLLRARRMTLAEILDAGVAQERVVRLTIYALAITRYLDLGVPGSRAPVGINRDRPAVMEAAQVAIREQPAATPAPPQATPNPGSARTSAPTVPPPRKRTGTLTSEVPSNTPPPPPGASAHIRPGDPPRVETPAPPRISLDPPAARPTTRMARVTGPASPPPQIVEPPRTPVPTPEPPPARSPPPRRPLPFGATPGSLVDGPPASRPTTKLPRVSMPTPGFDPTTDVPEVEPASTREPISPPSVRGASRAPPSPGAYSRTPEPPSVRAPAMSSNPARSITASPITPAPLTPSAPITATSPGAVRPEHAARRADIERRAASIDSEDLFQILGLTRETPADQIRNAYFALAKTWHPDRVPPELAEVKPLVARVFARISDAFQTLNDATKRKEYLERLQAGGGAHDDDEKIARVVDAAMEFQKAEILLKKNDLAGAEQLATACVRADPEQPEYLALLVWIQAQRRGDPPGMREGMTSPHFDDLIKLLDGVLAKEPSYERAIYYRGVLLKRAGRHDKAMRDFKQAVELNPKNIDAVREVRLHDMRKRGAAAAKPESSGPADGGGLFGKFFKR
jgi:curved DNA-binding protein CbpA